LNQLRHLEQICFPLDAWPLWDLIGVLTFPNVVRLKADHAGRMVGFIAGDIRDLEKTSWISTIGVLPEYRSQGIGRRLLEACEKKLPTDRIRLCVRNNNEIAIRLYRLNGYEALTQWKHYYQDGEDALVMEKIRL
jgi:ribosomal protein S18 acetylase RimI-like enzyme